MRDIAMSIVKRGYGWGNRADWIVMMPFLLLLLICGCESSQSHTAWLPENHSFPHDAAELKSGDVIKISFAGAPDLDTQQKVRPDGKITLPMAGEEEIQVAGHTPKEVEAEILRVFKSQLNIQEVAVTLEATANVIYVTGAVQQPGKIPMERPLTVLEAIMETGGFVPGLAKVDQILVIRHEGDERMQFHVDLEPALSGKPSNPFYLKPYDIVHVPRKGTSLFDPSL